MELAQRCQHASLLQLSPLESQDPYQDSFESQSLHLEKLMHYNLFNEDYAHMMHPHDEFELVLEDQQYTTVEQDHQSGQAADLLKSIFCRPKIKKKPNGARFYNKNICRYIVSQALRVLQQEQYAVHIRLICQAHDTDYETFRTYYMSQRSTMMGVQLFKQHLVAMQDEDPGVVGRKHTFQAYMVWYLDNLATRQLLRGKNKIDVRAYLGYKNYVMTCLVANPRGHVGNAWPTWAS